MFAYWRRPHPDLASVILRLGLGFIFMAHGYIKVFQPLSWTEVISRNMQNTVGWAELVFGILLALGFLSRLAALGVVADMIGAIVLVTGSRSFITIEMGAHGFTFRASGFEYNLMIIVASLAVVVLGSGWFSLDYLLFGRKKAPARATTTTEPHLQAGDFISSR